MAREIIFYTKKAVRILQTEAGNATELISKLLISYYGTKENCIVQNIMEFTGNK